MRIGLKYLGSAHALYDLSREEQIEWLAYDQVEQEG